MQIEAPVEQLPRLCVFIWLNSGSNTVYAGIVKLTAKVIWQGVYHQFYTLLILSLMECAVPVFRILYAANLA